MKIGILQTGRSPETLQKNFGDYNDLFMKLFKQQDFEFTTYAVIDSIFPKNPTEMDAWLITGSRHGAYEKLAWIPPLENFIRSAYKAKVPIVAICFGHQILAQALGGKVEKFKGGMKCGVEKLNLKGSSQPAIKAGIIVGRVISKKTLIGVAPKSKAASSMEESISTNRD